VALIVHSALEDAEAVAETHYRVATNDLVAALGNVKQATLVMADSRSSLVVASNWKDYFYGMELGYGTDHLSQTRPRNRLQNALLRFAPMHSTIAVYSAGGGAGDGSFCTLVRRGSFFTPMQVRSESALASSELPKDCVCLATAEQLATVELSGFGDLARRLAEATLREQEAQEAKRGEEVRGA
jgi:hypothetical protein